MQAKKVSNRIRTTDGKGWVIVYDYVLIDANLEFLNKIKEKVPSLSTISSVEEISKYSRNENYYELKFTSSLYEDLIKIEINEIYTVYLNSDKKLIYPFETKLVKTPTPGTVVSPLVSTPQPNSPNTSDLGDGGSQLPPTTPVESPKPPATPASSGTETENEDSDKDEPQPSPVNSEPTAAQQLAKNCLDQINPLLEKLATDLEGYDFLSEDSKNKATALLMKLNDLRDAYNANLLAGMSRSEANQKLLSGYNMEIKTARNSLSMDLGWYDYFANFFRKLSNLFMSHISDNPNYLFKIVEPPFIPEIDSAHNQLLLALS